MSDRTYPTLQLQLQNAATGKLSDALALHKHLSNEVECGVFWGDGEYFVADIANGKDSFVYLPIPQQAQQIALAQDKAPYLKSFKALWQTFPVNVDEIRKSDLTSERIESQMLMIKAIEYYRPDLLKIAIAHGADVNFTGYLNTPVQSVMSMWLTSYIDTFKMGNKIHQCLQNLSLVFETGKVDLNKTLYSEKALKHSRSLPIAGELILSVLDNQQLSLSALSTSRDVLNLMFKHGADVHYEDKETKFTLPMLAFEAITSNLTTRAAVKEFIEELFMAGADPKVISTKGDLEQQIKARFPSEFEQRQASSILGMIERYNLQKDLMGMIDSKLSQSPAAPAVIHSPKRSQVL